jgi:hypothetical protein
MSHALRLPVSVAVFGLIAAGVYSFRPDVLAPAWHPLEHRNVLAMYAKESERDEQLRERLSATRRRLSAQQQICRELIEGRLALGEAAWRVSVLPAPPAHFWELLRSYYPGESDEECLCRSVLKWAQVELQGEPAQAESFSRRWQTELPGQAAEVRQFWSSQPPTR